MSRIALLLIVALAACSKSKPADHSGSAAPVTTPPPADAMMSIDAAAEGSAAGSDTGSAVGSGAGSAAEMDGGTFDKLSHDEKVKVMKTQVMPAMKTAFQEFDPKKYASFGCKTCHGKDPQKAKYKMPNAELPKLDFDALKAGKDKKAAEFMAKTVKPEMAKIFGRPEMSETNKAGFGCLDCHMMKTAK